MKELTWVFLVLWIHSQHVVALAPISGKRDLSQQVSRRGAFGVALAGLWTTSVSSASAASSGNAPSPKDLERIQKGHARVQYLLSQWDDVTRVCGTAVMSDTERKQVVRTEGGGGTDMCSRTPLKVQEYLGYKSTEDPLFKIDKVMLRAASLVDSDRYADYLDVVERYRENADATALLAYTSSWGEANPNGGKEVMEDYLDQTKAAVIETEKLLREVMAYLKLEILPSSAKP